MDRKTNKRKQEEELVFRAKEFQDRMRKTKKFFRAEISKFKEVHDIANTVVKEYHKNTKQAEISQDFVSFVMYFTSIQTRMTYRNLANILTLLSFYAERIVNLEARDQLNQLMILAYGRAIKQGNGKIKNLNLLSKKIVLLEKELKKREKGLNWVDNLITHTPETEKGEGVQN